MVKQMRLIDANALMPRLKFIREAEHQIYGKESWGFASKCITAVEDAPTIEERKTGKWQRKYSRPGVYADLCWHCSICGGKFSDTYANMWKYCPDCGSYNGGNNDDNS